MGAGERVTVKDGAMVMVGVISRVAVRVHVGVNANVGGNVRVSVGVTVNVFVSIPTSEDAKLFSSVWVSTMAVLATAV